MPPQSLHPAYTETGPHRPQRGVLGEACAYVLLGTGVVVSVAGLILLAGSWILWTVLALLIALPRLAEIALGAALLISTVLVLPDTEDLAVMSALAVLVPVPLAAVIDRKFFRR